MSCGRMVSGKVEPLWQQHAVQVGWERMLAEHQGPSCLLAAASAWLWPSSHSLVVQCLHLHQQDQVASLLNTKMCSPQEHLWSMIVPLMEFVTSCQDYSMRSHANQEKPSNVMPLEMGMQDSAPTHMLCKMAISEDRCWTTFSQGESDLYSMVLSLRMQQKEGECFLSPRVLRGPRIGLAGGSAPALESCCAQHDMQQLIW